MFVALAPLAYAYLAVLADLRLPSAVPSNWHSIRAPIWIPKELNVNEPPRPARIDVTGRYFYTGSCQVDLTNGVTRPCSTFIVFGEYRKEMIQASFDVEETNFKKMRGLDDFMYASKDLLAGYIGGHGYFCGRIGGPPQPAGRGVETLRGLGLALERGQEDVNDKVGPNGPVITHGSQGVQLPKTMKSAHPIVNGIDWTKQTGDFVWNRGHDHLHSGKPEGILQAHLYRIHFGRHPVTFQRIPDPTTQPEDAPLYGAEIALADDSIIKLSRKRSKSLWKNPDDAIVYIYRPKAKRWEVHKRMCLWGSSHDGRLILYSVAPWMSNLV